MFGRHLPWYWTPILLACLLVVLDVEVRNRIKDTAYWMLESASGEEGPRIRNASYSFGGTLRVHEITLEPAPGAEPIRVGSVEVETPGFWWVVQQVLPKDRPSRSEKLLDALSGETPEPDWYFPPTPRLAIQLHDVDWGDYMLGFLVPELDWVGGYTGALFEAEGCPEDGYWSRGDLNDRLKLDPGSGDIRIEYETTGERTLKRTVHIGSEGLAQLTIVSDYTLPDDARQFLDLLWEPWRTTSTRWTLEDHGFNARRNAFCAEAAGVDVETFIARHLQAVERTLAAEGVRASAELLQTYADHVRNGGTLVWTTRLGPGRAWEDYEEASLSATIAGLSPILTVNGKSVNYLVEEIPERPWPDYDYGSTWSLLEIEAGRRPGPAASAAAAPATAAAPVVAAAVPVNAPAAASKDIDPRQLDAHVGDRIEITLDSSRRLRGVLEAIDARQLRLRVSIGGGYASMDLERSRVVKARRG